MYYDVGGKLFNGIQEVEVHMGFGGETILEENQLEKLRLRRELRSLRMESLQVRMRPQER